MRISLLIFSLLISGCSLFGEKKTDISSLNSKGTFNYVDKSGKYLLRQVVTKNEKNDLVFKKSLEIPHKEKDHILEQVVSVSELGFVKKTQILRPLQSQYNVWFNGKKFSSEMKIDAKKKAVILKINDPEKKSENTQTIIFPRTKLHTCFFSQILECMKVTGYVDRSLKINQAAMKLQIIWDGYPFFNETLSDFPVELFSTASFSFDGKLADDQLRFNLETSGQSIFYIMNRKLELLKVFWVTQGISMSRSDLKEMSLTEESEDE